MMKKMIFATALSFTSLASAALPTNVDCVLVRLTGNGGVVLASTKMNCAAKDYQVQKSAVGPVSFACTNNGQEIRVEARMEQNGEALSSGRKLPAQESSQFASYYATVNDSLMVSCQNN